MSLRELLKGIDETEAESPEGWWETSKGSEFGALILNQALALEAKLEADNKALRNELEALKASQNKIKADTIREAVESNRTIGYVEDYFGTITNNEKIEINDLIEYANKLEAGK